MDTNLQTWSDEELLCRAFSIEDDAEAGLLAGLFVVEIERRWGVGADDRLADYLTASHASPSDMQNLAHNETALLVEIAKGEHDCGNHSGDFTRIAVVALDRYQCRCGRIWAKANGVYYDPTEATADEVLAATR